MKRFVLQEKRYDNRFNDRLLAGKAYADAADNYLPESISRYLERDEKVLLMVLSERFEMHPIDVLNEGFLDTAKNWLKKITKYSEADPETAAEMEKIQKRKQGIFKRYAKARGDQASIFQSIKYGLGGGLWPQVSAAGETFIPGLQGKAKLKAQAEMNLQYKKLKKQLEGELGNVWGRLASQLKKMPDPDEGGFPNNPNPKDFVQIMYGDGFETMDEVDAALSGDQPQLGGLVGSVLGTRDALQQLIDDRIITKDQGAQLMKKARELFAVFKGSLERQYFTLENNNGKDGPLLHRTTMQDLMFEEVVVDEQMVAKELSDFDPAAMGMDDAEPVELTPEEQKQLDEITPEQMKAIFSGKISDVGIDTSIIEKTQIEKKAKLFFIAAAITAIAGVAIFLFGRSEEAKAAIAAAKASMEKKAVDYEPTFDMQDPKNGFNQLTDEFTKQEEFKKILEIGEGDGITMTRWEGIEDLTDAEIRAMDYDKWSNSLFAQFGNSKEKWIEAMTGKMEDPAQAWDDMHEAQGKGLDVQSTFRPDGKGPLGWGGGTSKASGLKQGKASFSLTKTGVVGFMKKQAMKKGFQVVGAGLGEVAKDPTKAVGAVLGVKGAVAAAGGISGAGALAVAAAPWVLGASSALLAMGLVRKFKDSRQKQLQRTLDFIDKPFVDPPEKAPDWEKIGVDPDVIPPEPEDPRKPIEDPEVAASLDLVKRALKKSGYPENEIDPLLNSLWDGVDPNPKAPERLTTDSEQEMLRTSAWRKYSLMPLMTESPAALLLMEDDVKYKKFIEYMHNAAKHANVTKPNKKQIEQAAFAFNIANGIGDVSELPDKYKKGVSKKKMKELEKKLKRLEAEKDGMVKKKWKKKAKNRKVIIDELEDSLNDFKGKYGESAQKLKETLKELEAGKIEISEYLEQIQAMEEDRQLTYDQTEQLRMDLEAQIDALTQAKDDESLRLTGEINKMADELKGFEGALTTDMQDELITAIQGSMGEDVDPTIFFSNPMGYINTWMDNARGESDEKVAEMESKLGELEPELDELRAKLEKLQKSGKNFEKKGKTYKLAKELTRILYGKNKFFSGATNAIPKKKKTYLKKFNDGEERLDKTLPELERIIKDFMNNKDFGKDKEVKINDSYSRKGDLLREQKEVAQTLTRWQKLAGIK